MGPPFGHDSGEPDVGDDHHQGRDDQSGAELDPEDDADDAELDDGRGDVEEQEIEHHVDALGAALDDLGQRAGPPLEVEAERQPMDVGEDLLRQPPGRVLPDPLENGVAQILEQDPGEARAGISEHQPDGEADRRVRPLRAPRHDVDRAFVDEAGAERDALGEQDEEEGDHHPGLQPRLSRGPKIRKEPPHRAPAGAGRGFGGGFEEAHARLR